MGECLGICQRYETTGDKGYKKGFKFCTRCGLFIKLSSRICVCCKTQLRVKNREHPPLYLRKEHSKIKSEGGEGVFFG